MCVTHDGKVGCITVKYTTVFLYCVSVFLWDDINRFNQPLSVKAVLRYNWIPISGYALRVYPSWLSSSSELNTLDHVYGRCILRWHNLKSSCTLSSAEATLVRLVGQSSEGVPGLPSPPIHSPPMTCLSTASLAGTLIGYDAGLLLTSEEDSKAAFVQGELKTFACSLKCN